MMDERTTNGPHTDLSQAPRDWLGSKRRQPLSQVAYDTRHGVAVRRSRYYLVHALLVCGATLALLLFVPVAQLRASEGPLFLLAIGFLVAAGTAGGYLLASDAYLRLLGPRTILDVDRNVVQHRGRSGSTPTFPLTEIVGVQICRDTDVRGDPIAQVNLIRTLPGGDLQRLPVMSGATEQAHLVGERLSHAIRKPLLDTLGSRPAMPPGFPQG